MSFQIHLAFDTVSINNKHRAPSLLQEEAKFSEEFYLIHLFSTKILMRGLCQVCSEW